jgi:hypothetical protein
MARSDSMCDQDRTAFDMKGADMKQFELRFLNPLNECVSMRVFSAGDDLNALAEAERLSETHIVEVWEGSRKVARVKKGNAALTPEDGQCG